MKKGAKVIGSMVCAGLLAGMLGGTSVWAEAGEPAELVFWDMMLSLIHI